MGYFLGLITGVIIILAFFVIDVVVASRGRKQTVGQQVQRAVEKRAGAKGEILESLQEDLSTWVDKLKND